MSKEDAKPDFVFHLPQKVKFTKEQHKEFNNELNRVTKLILASNTAALLTKLRDEVAGLEGKRTSVNFDGYELALTTETYEESPLILRSEVLALLEKAGE